MSDISLVSVIIDNYNYGGFIGEAIESVLGQTYTNFELIIVDDGSTDNSREIIDSYYNQNPNKIITVYKENGGQASAFNEGFKIAKGDIIAFLDSDDYWFEDKLVKIVEAHRDFAIVQHNLIKGDNKFFDILQSGPIQSLFKQYGFYGKVMPTSALSFTYDVLSKVFPIPEVEAVRICADAYVISGALYFESLYSLDEALGVYRIHGANHFCNAGDDTTRSGKIVAVLNGALKKKGLIPVPCHNTQADALVSAIEVRPGFSYLIYGTGAVALKLYARILEQGASVQYFCDSNPEKWGTFIQGKKVVAPYEIGLVRQQFDKVAIGSTYIEDILYQLSILGYSPKMDIIFPGMDL